MLSNPTVSVIIPLFNRSNLIVETLGSLIDQTYKNWEAIVVDDGSTDNSFKVVTEIAKKEKRIELYKRNKNPKGASTCRNIGIEKSNGEYIMFLDSDDLLADYCLKERVSEFDKNYENDFLVFKGLRFRNNIFDQKLLISSFEQGDPFPFFLNFDIPWANLNPIYKKESLVQKNIFWDENIIGYQDVQFHLAVLSHGLKYEIVSKKPDCFWRIHDFDNIGKGLFNKSENINSHILLVNSVYNSLYISNQLTETNKKLLSNFIFKIIEFACKKQKFTLQYKAIRLLKKCNLLTNRKLYVILKSFYFVKFFFTKATNHLDLLISNKVKNKITISKPKEYFLKKYIN